MLEIIDSSAGQSPEMRDKILAAVSNINSITDASVRETVINDVERALSYLQPATISPGGTAAGGDIEIVKTSPIENPDGTFVIGVTRTIVSGGSVIVDGETVSSPGGGFTTNQPNDPTIVCIASNGCTSTTQTELCLYNSASRLYLASDPSDQDAVTMCEYMNLAHRDQSGGSGGQNTKCYKKTFAGKIEVPCQTGGGGGGGDGGGGVGGGGGGVRVSREGGGGGGGGGSFSPNPNPCTNGSTNCDGVISAAEHAAAVILDAASQVTSENIANAYVAARTDAYNAYVNSNLNGMDQEARDIYDHWQAVYHEDIAPELVKIGEDLAYLFERMGESSEWDETKKLLTEIATWCVEEGFPQYWDMVKAGTDLLVTKVAPEYVEGTLYYMEQGIKQYPETRDGILHAYADAAQQATMNSETLVSDWHEMCQNETLLKALAEMDDIANEYRDDIVAAYQVGSEFVFDSYMDAADASFSAYKRASSSSQGRKAKAGLVKAKRKAGKDGARAFAKLSRSIATEGQNAVEYVGEKVDYLTSKGPQDLLVQTLQAYDDTTNDASKAYHNALNSAVGQYVMDTAAAGESAAGKELTRAKDTFIQNLQNAPDSLHEAGVKVAAKIEECVSGRNLSCVSPEAAPCSTPELLEVCNQVEKAAVMYGNAILGAGEVAGAAINRGVDWCEDNFPNAGSSIMEATEKAMSYLNPRIDAVVETFEEIGDRIADFGGDVAKAFKRIIAEKSAPSPSPFTLKAVNAWTESVGVADSAATYTVKIESDTKRMGLDMNKVSVDREAQLSSDCTNDYFCIVVITKPYIENDVFTLTIAAHGLFSEDGDSLDRELRVEVSQAEAIPNLTVDNITDLGNGLYEVSGTCQYGQSDSENGIVFRVDDRDNQLDKEYQIGSSECASSGSYTAQINLTDFRNQRSIIYARQGFIEPKYAYRKFWVDFFDDSSVSRPELQSAAVSPLMQDPENLRPLSIQLEFSAQVSALKVYLTKSSFTCGNDTSATLYQNFEAGTTFSVSNLTLSSGGLEGTHDAVCAEIAYGNNVSASGLLLGVISYDPTPPMPAKLASAPAYSLGQDGQTQVTLTWPTDNVFNSTYTVCNADNNSATVRNAQCSQSVLATGQASNGETVSVSIPTSPNPVIIKTTRENGKESYSIPMIFEPSTLSDLSPAGIIRLRNSAQYRDVHIVNIVEDTASPGDMFIAYRYSQSVSNSSYGTFVSRTDSNFIIDQSFEGKITPPNFPAGRGTIVNKPPMVSLPKRAESGKLYSQVCIAFETSAGPLANNPTIIGDQDETSNKLACIGKMVEPENEGLIEVVSNFQPFDSITEASIDGKIKDMKVISIPDQGYTLIVGGSYFGYSHKLKFGSDGRYISSTPLFNDVNNNVDQPSVETIRIVGDKLYTAGRYQAQSADGYISDSFSKFSILPNGDVSQDQMTGDGGLYLSNRAITAMEINQNSFFHCLKDSGGTILAYTAWLSETSLGSRGYRSLYHSCDGFQVMSNLSGVYSFGVKTSATNHLFTWMTGADPYSINQSNPVAMYWRVSDYNTATMPRVYGVFESSLGKVFVYGSFTHAGGQTDAYLSPGTYLMP